MAIEIICRGPVDSYGDPKPNGISRIGLAIKLPNVLHHMTLDVEQIEALRDELTGALYQIAINRAAVEARNKQRREADNG